MSNLLSRQITIPATTENITVFSPNFAYDHKWRLSCREVSGNTRINITIELLHTETTEDLTFSVGAGGGSAISLSGPAIIKVSNPGGVAAILDAAITQRMPLVDLIEYDEASQALGAAYVDLGSNGGKPQPFYNYASLYLSAAADVRVVGLGGGMVLFEVLGVNPQTLLLNQFRIGDNNRLQARGAGVNAKVIWYNRR